MIVSLLLVGIASAQECTELDIDQQAERAVMALTSADFELAERLADDGISALPCAKRVVDPQDLATLWQVKGAVGIYGNKPELTQASLAQAAAVNPTWFNDRLGAPVEQAWKAQVQLLSAGGDLRVWPLPDGSSLYVDGVVQERPDLRLPAGEHLVQVALGADVIYAQMLSISGGDVLNIETGLEEPTLTIPSRLPWILAGVGGLAAAGAGYGVAYSINDEMAAAAADGNTEQLDSLWRLHVVSGYVAAPVLAVAGVGVATIGLRRRQRAIAAMDLEPTE